MQPRKENLTKYLQCWHIEYNLISRDGSMRHKSNNIIEENDESFYIS